MRVLLVNPPLYPVSEITPPVGLSTLAVWLKNKHLLKILDLDLEIRLHRGSDPRALCLKLLDELIDEFLPDVIGFTSMYNNSLQAEQLIRASKAKGKNILTVAGGPHFGAQGEEALNRITDLDFVIEGEGEIALEKLLDSLSGIENFASVPNLCYRSNGKVLTNSKGPLLDLSLIPPVWSNLKDILNLDRYLETQNKSSIRRGIYIEAGRGCPYNCTFCAPAQFWDRRFRVKSTSTIIDEMSYLNKKFKYDSFLLIHDLLTADKKFVSRFSKELSNKKLNVEWMANARIDNSLTELLPEMKQSGCFKLFYGVESASERIQFIVDKHLKKQQILDTISSLMKFEIDATCSFVIGFPDESSDELSDTIALGARLKLFGVETIQYHRLRLFPPAPLAKAKIPYTFDMETLKLEFPFKHVNKTEIDDIRSSPSFFAGYFAPKSTAGDADQLAQVELFFSLAVSLAPLTTCALAYSLGTKLIPEFYLSLLSLGQIDRYAVDWAADNKMAHFNLLIPFFDFLIDRTADAESYQDMIRSVRDYEQARMNVVLNNDWRAENAVFSSPGCLVIPTEVNIETVLKNLRDGIPISKTDASEANIMFLKSPTNKVMVFQGTTFN